jgi:signal transduction histidine kinase
LEEGACAPSMERWFSYLEESERTAGMWRFFEACMTQQPGYRADHCLQRADGSTRWVRVSTMLQYDAQNRLVHVSGIVLDIHDLRTALAAAHEDRDGALENMAVVAHDLSNPLSAISATSLQLVRAGEPDPKLARLANRIQRSAERMTRMLEQLLDVTQMREGIFALTPSAFELSDLLQDLIEETKLAFPQCALRVDQVGDTRGCWDRERLAQLVSNLVGNAAQHGTGAVQVTLDGTDPYGVELSVHNGGELPEDLLPRLFEPFTRTRTPQRRRGLGLGLYIAQQVARAHGTEIRVNSHADHGTTFRVRLPRNFGP